MTKWKSQKMHMLHVYILDVIMKYKTMIKQKNGNYVWVRNISKLKLRTIMSNKLYSINSL